MFLSDTVPLLHKRLYFRSIGGTEGKLSTLPDGEPPWLSTQLESHCHVSDVGEMFLPVHPFPGAPCLYFMLLKLQERCTGSSFLIFKVLENAGNIQER